MPIQPRIDEPSNPRPSVNVSLSRCSRGNEQCCQLPSMSTNFRSTISASCFLAKAKKSSGVIETPPDGKRRGSREAWPADAHGRDGGGSIADLVENEGRAANFVGLDKAGVDSYCRTRLGRDIICPLCARPPSPEPKVVREPHLQSIGHIRTRERTDRHMGSAALAEAAKSIRDWSLANGAHTPPAVKAAERLWQSCVQRQASAGAVVEDGVPRAESDDHARRATRHRDR